MESGGREMRVACLEFGCSVFGYRNGQILPGPESHVENCHNPGTQMQMYVLVENEALFTSKQTYKQTNNQTNIDETHASYTLIFLENPRFFNHIICTIICCAACI